MYQPKHRGNPVVMHRVHYIERERGWGSDEWDTDYNHKDEALAAVATCNSRNTSATAPDCYIIASYIGPITL